jgi:hypothetical protein
MSHLPSHGRMARIDPTHTSSCLTSILVCFGWVLVINVIRLYTKMECGGDAMGVWVVDGLIVSIAHYSTYLSCRHPTGRRRLPPFSPVIHQIETGAASVTGVERGEDV